MEKERKSKLALADLIAKKAAKEASQNRTEEVYVDSLEGSLTIHIPLRSSIYKAMDMGGENMEDSMYSNAFLIYHAVKEFQSQELLEAYGVKDNIDIVFSLLTPVEIAEVSTKIMQLSGYAKPEQIQSNLKN